MNKEILKNIKVLYVEDENDVREFTGKTIGAIVKEVIIAENGKVGLEKFQENLDIDLIVTDINMPKMGGLEMCAEIKKIDSTIPIVITSAHNDPNFLKKAIDVGVNAYAMKPVDLYQLIDSMISAVEPIYLRKQLEAINTSLESKVEEGVKQIKSILDAQDNIVVVTDGEEIRSVNKRFTEFFGVSNIEEFNSKHGTIPTLFLEEDGFFHLNRVDNDANAKTWIQNLDRLHEIDRIVKLKNLSGENRIFKINIDDYEHKGEHFVISFTDITEIKEKSNLLEYQANHDTLTGLFNRQRFYDIYAKEIRRDRRYENNLSIILFDIDHFKRFNDDFGHDMGDIVLKTLAEIVTKAVREHDTIVRWGGEEFIVLLPETPLEGAQKVAEKIRVSIETYKDDTIPKQITSSFGVTSLKNEDNEDTFIKRADEALYEAKETGRNKVVVREN